MSFSYYIKNRITDHSKYFKDEEKKIKIKELLDNIYECCTNGNIGKNEYKYEKINRENPIYEIRTDIIFKDITGKYNDNVNVNDLEIEKKILAIEDKKDILTSRFLNNSYFQDNNSALIAFDENDDIYTILTFYYNTGWDCIEVEAFWSNPGGGGIIMNYLINAIKCGISRCKEPKNYKRELILYSVDAEDTKNFYRKFKFIETETQSFTRQLSLGSVDSIDDEEILENLNEVIPKNLNEELLNLYGKLEANYNVSIAFTKTLRNLYLDQKIIDNTNTEDAIYKAEKKIYILGEQKIDLLKRIIEIKKTKIKFISEIFNFLKNIDIRNEITKEKNIPVIFDFFNNKNIQEENKFIIDYMVDSEKVLDKMKELTYSTEFIEFTKEYLEINNYDGMEIERALTGIIYDINDEDEIKNIKNMEDEIKNIKNMEDEVETNLQMKETGNQIVNERPNFINRIPSDSQIVNEPQLSYIPNYEYEDAIPSAPSLPPVPRRPIVTSSAPPLPYEYEKGSRRRGGSNKKRKTKRKSKRKTKRMIKSKRKTKRMIKSNKVRRSTKSKKLIYFLYNKK
jgi:hypothetical protein